jgi:hypothetical protein
MNFPDADRRSTTSPPYLVRLSSSHVARQLADGAFLEDRPMFTRKLPAFILGVLSLAVLLAAAVPAAAQSTFVVPFDRSGTPGTETIDVVDPLTGLTAPMIVATGAFDNPCTGENVDVFGSTAISSVQTFDKFGNMKVSVSTVTKGTGTGWSEPFGEPTPSGNTYAFTDSQQFTFRFPPAGGQEFSSDFSDKLSLRGAKSLDNWVVRAHFRIRITSAGEVKVLLIKMDPDPNCKG